MSVPPPPERFSIPLNVTPATSPLPSAVTLQVVAVSGPSSVSVPLPPVRVSTLLKVIVAPPTMVRLPESAASRFQMTSSSGPTISRLPLGLPLMSMTSEMGDVKSSPAEPETLMVPSGLTVTTTLVASSANGVRSSVTLGAVPVTSIPLTGPASPPPFPKAARDGSTRPVRSPAPSCSPITASPES